MTKGGCIVWLLWFSCISIQAQESYLRGSQVVLHKESHQSWFSITPIDSSYEQFPGQKTRIGYQALRIAGQADSLLLDLSSLGTFLLGKWTINADSLLFFTSNPLNDSTFLLSVRQDDSYLGYLSEMLGVPFVLPPMRLPSGEHQTDLRLGTDCAELAIYGRRRMGLNIPYVGPRRLFPYVVHIPKDSLFEGALIHFRDQVSVLYKDKKPLGILNGEDLLIQSFEAKVKIISWEESGFLGRDFKAYRWK